MTKLVKAPARRVGDPSSNSRSAQWIVWVTQLVRVPALRAGDPGSNPGPGENCSLKFLIITQMN